MAKSFVGLKVLGDLCSKLCAFKCSELMSLLFILLTFGGLMMGMWSQNV
jgi:hypothetical protein